ncbi:hypothetical protein GCM10023209_19100 [Roseibacterium beibuensis]|uniref:Uncharacterized protein n=1 Tax=[Roseibacterium] beibuensis TaxID=1193142 RepID=A0ABP9LC28_9RHOB
MAANSGVLYVIVFPRLAVIRGWRNGLIGAARDSLKSATVRPYHEGPPRKVFAPKIRHSRKQSRARWLLVAPAGTKGRSNGLRSGSWSGLVQPNPVVDRTRGDNSQHIAATVLESPICCFRGGRMPGQIPLPLWMKDAIVKKSKAFS